MKHLTMTVLVATVAYFAPAFDRTKRKAVAAHFPAHRRLW